MGNKITLEKFQNKSTKLVEQNGLQQHSSTIQQSDEAKLFNCETNN